MRTKARQSGLSMTEMTVVVAIVATLTALSLPATRAFFKSIATAGGTRAMISASLAQARAIAAKEQRYAGVRFQKAYNPDAPGDPLKADQYIIFIVQDPEIMGYGFRVVEGTKPIKLPDNSGVMDLTIVTGRRSRQYIMNSVQLRLDDSALTNPDDWINDTLEIADTTTFSILFSPSGKLVIHGVRVRNRDGIQDTAAKSGNISFDSVFNKKIQVDAEIGMFYQDDYYDGTDASPFWGNLGIGPEPSRRSLLIYERDKFKTAYQQGIPWTGYLQELVNNNKVIHINSYTGRIISNE